MPPRKKKSTTSDYKQMDVVNAFRGKDVVFDLDDNTSKGFEPKKKLSFFDFINDIRKSKTTTMLDSEENHTAWNTFMVLQGLSMKDADIPICNFFNKYMGSMTKKQMYIALTHLIPKDTSFYKWVSAPRLEKNALAECISDYFECSQTEAIEYINIMGEEWASSIKSKYGGEVIKKKGKIK